MKKGCNKPPHWQQQQTQQVRVAAALLQAFCKLAGIQVSPLQDITPEQLAAAPFKRYTPPLANIQVGWLLRCGRCSML
jgi:hypothetical protein